MSPRKIFRYAAIAEAVTWTLLLAGMFLKYVTETTELGVRIGGMAHGVVFIAYCLITVVVAIDARWTLKRTALGLLAAIPPYFTVWFDVAMDRRGALAQDWRLSTATPSNALERLASWLIRRPGQGIAAGLVAVAALTSVALLLGPPVG
ncbi:MAG TPA: DUF3817 domain-containing protein [Aeromicrobium sp.]|nr:DUF3817 domain-containing protein [Aeromicrobium sp.]